MLLYEIISRVNNLFTSPQDNQYGCILFGVISPEPLRIRPVFLPGARHASLHTLNLINHDISHTA